VEEALLAVGTGITALGMPDPRKEVPGSDRNHPLLASYLNALSDEDDLHTRAYPANITIIQHMYQILDTAHPIHGRFNQHIIDLCIVGFFWLLRPAEYLSTDLQGRSQAFCLQDITFMIGNRLVPATNTSLNDFNTESRITWAAPTFNNQKNPVRGKQIGHAATNDPQLCPCKALAASLRIWAQLARAQMLPSTSTNTLTSCASMSVLQTSPTHYVTQPTISSTSPALNPCCSVRAACALAEPLRSSALASTQTSSNF
jgi:hypothetical protein